MVGIKGLIVRRGAPGKGSGLQGCLEGAGVENSG